MIEYRDILPDKHQYARLFATTGWNDEYALDAEQLRAAIGGSWYAVSAYDGGELVGFGRLISDGVLHALVVDLIVLPERQGQGIGRAILGRLIERCEARGVRDVQLFCARGKRGFYEKMGFEARSTDAPGMQLVRLDR